ncbi:tRNA methyltransferase complex GCD14 subunit family protein [Theileria parva strain Muguga]|uniref:tRNA (adenine(58)-N(1))-methyltransferase n=1 Tax=Theileria parva TaxID=5875 RepID=Q4N407_THEPA|nr:tRNA methyltransferase complex GCD14 subunit family protein [Theileria parva strain Muguga]EAN33116.1 tRNA methyltransferase complex GCD14 subunit family protein [Theileria parva strain Muguga]|eukprot:XP_765399.1 hypothetical protein [Theileria parva strain Muguga]
MKIEPGDPVILFSGPNNIYFSQIPKEDQKIPNKQSEANVKNKRLIHNKKGIFDLASCIGKFYGQKLFWDENNKKHWVVLLKPTPELITKSIIHRTQILYRADISLIVLLLDLMPGKRVLECGTGSGSLSYALASSVAPNGHVFTFDFHPQRIQYSMDLFEKTKISDLITVTETDAYSDNAFLVNDPTHSVTEHSIDSVFLDIPSPWNCIHNVTSVIKHFGKLVIFIPSIEQCNKITECLHSSGYMLIRTFEVLTKPWGISFTNSDTADSDDEDPVVTGKQVDNTENLGEYVNYQLPQFNHTGYITVATSNIY